MTTPSEIDNAIAQQAMIVHTAERAVTRWERMLEGDAYLRIQYDEEQHFRSAEELDYHNAELRKLTALYTGWTRYWHVTNNNGHIHTSQHCTSCFPDTQYAWRTDLSGLTPEQVVEREAYNACSVCMPIAPAEQREARQRFNAEQRAERKSERQAKADEKLRKAAVRAQKLLAKVEAFYAEHGGREAVMAWDSHKLYDETASCHAMVGNEVYRQYHVQHGDAYQMREKNPQDAIDQATEKGLV